MSVADHATALIAKAADEYPGDPRRQMAFLATLAAAYKRAASPGYARWQPNEQPASIKKPPEALY